MKLIIWLWNPWAQYEKTRHNVGFLFLDFLVWEKTLSWEWKNEKKFSGEIFETIFNWEKTILLKPQTFMNLSWESVLKIMSFYKIDKKDIIIIFDDISLDFWKIRFRESWSAWWQNWVKSIISHIWEDFKRIKIWIGQDRKFDLSDWVLSKFTPEELNELNENIFKESLVLLEKNF
jgi:PTH1 family peptidyl-tRNA hydrolase